MLIVYPKYDTYVYKCVSVADIIVANKIYN